MLIKRCSAIFLFSCSIISLGQSSYAGGPQAFQAATSSNGLQIFTEVLGQVGDGRTRTFELATVPSDKAPIHVYMGNTELQVVADYYVQGKTITITGRTMGVPRDLIRITYAVEISTIQPQSLTIPVPVAVTPIEVPTAQTMVREQSFEHREQPVEHPDDSDSLSQLLNRSLRNELASAKALTQENHSESLPAPKRALVRNPASLRMLAEAIDRGEQKDPEEQKISRSSKGVRSNVAGPEGLGDSAVQTPYDFLAASPNGLDTNIDRLDASANSQRGASKSTKGPHRVAGSLVMLQQRLADHE